jgi:hypothetical protein
MSWDLAYNLSHEVEDRDAKWSWIIAGIDTNVRGVTRNPQSERLLRHLAWMFHHKGDLFHDKIEALAWASRLNPLLKEVNARVKPGYQVALLEEGIYQACIALGDGSLDGQGRLSAQFVRRMVPLALESDGNLKRNQSRHLEALKRYVDSLQAWDVVIAWANAPAANPYEVGQHKVTLDSVERNEGRLRRKAAQYCYDLAPDSDTAEKTAQAILARNWSEALRHLQRPGWKSAASNSRIHWLDEPG